MPLMMNKLSTGKGDVNVDVQCTDVCSDVCTQVPQKVCNDVPYQTQVCSKVPAPETKQVCNRICTKTTTREEQIETPSTVVSTGKGKGGDSMVMVSAGKGHRKLSGTEMLPLLAVGHLAGKAVVAKAAGAVIGAKAFAATAAVHSGKGVAMEAPQEDVQCQDVCNDVQIMKYETQCQQVQQMKTKCDIVMNQQCNKVCKPSCKKITTTTTTTTQALSMGKGGQQVMMSYGKGH